MKVSAAVLSILTLILFLARPGANIDPDADIPIKRINAGHAATVKIPLEETLERIRSYPHRKDALIRSLGATALKQRAGRNLIFRVLLTIGKCSTLIRVNGLKETLRANSRLQLRIIYEMTLPLVNSYLIILTNNGRINLWVIYTAVVKNNISHQHGQWLRGEVSQKPPVIEKKLANPPLSCKAGTPHPRQIFRVFRGNFGVFPAIIVIKNWI